MKKYFKCSGYANGLSADIRRQDESAGTDNQRIVKHKGRKIFVCPWAQDNPRYATGDKVQLRTKMYQNTCVGFKLGYVDAKPDAITFCVKTYSSDSFIKNRTNMHEMQNRMKIAFCTKLPLPSILLGDKECPM